MSQRTLGRRTTGFRFTFGSYHLLDGFHIVAIVVGLFAIPEMVWQVMRSDLDEKVMLPPVRVGLRALGLTLRHWANLLRSSALGAFFGAIPGASGVASSFVAYAAAKALARPEERYGEGAEGGVVATEGANNATVGGTFVPTLALGIPGDAGDAVLLGALIILGVFPGPALFDNRPEIVGGIFLVYLLANALLLVLGIVMTPLFAYVLRIRGSNLIPVVLLLCAVGTFALQASVFDLWAMLGFGLVGILFKAARYPLAPVVIGVILGPLLENNYRRSLLISRDGHWIFLDRPISATLLAIDALLIAGVVFYGLRQRRRRRVDRRGGM